MKWRLITFLILPLLVICCNQTANNSSAGSITLTDMAGREVQIDQPVKRVILLRGRDIYSLSAILDTDITNKLIAWGPDIKTSDVDAYRKYCETFPSLKNLTEIGDIFKDAIDIEQIITLKPDLIIAETFMKTRGYKTVEQMEALGLPIIYLDFERDPYSGPQQSMLIMGRIFNQEKRAEKIVGFVNEEIALVTNRLNTIQTPAPTLYLESGGSGPTVQNWTYGAERSGYYPYWAEVMRMARANNIADGVAVGHSAIDPEYILETDPSIIIITGANWPAASDALRMGYYADKNSSENLLKGYYNRPGWRTLSAVQNDKLYGIFHGFTMHLFNFAALQQIAKWLYPETFSDVDPEKNLIEYHKKFLPIKYSGCWMIGE